MYSSSTSSSFHHHHQYSSSSSSGSIWKNCHRPSLILSTPQLHDDFYSQPISWGIDQIVITLPQRFVAFPACSPQDFVDMTAQDLFYGSQQQQQQQTIPENVRVFRAALICTTGGGGGGGSRFSLNGDKSSIPEIDDSLFLGTTSSMIAHCHFAESSIILNRKLRISPLVAPNQYYNPFCYINPELEDEKHTTNGGDDDDEEVDEVNGHNDDDTLETTQQRKTKNSKKKNAHQPLCGITCMNQCGPSRSPCEIVVGTADGTVAIFDIRVASPFPVLEFGKRPNHLQSAPVPGVSASAFSPVVLPQAGFHNDYHHHHHEVQVQVQQQQHQQHRHHHSISSPSALSSSSSSNYERAHPPTTFSTTAVTGLAVDTFGSGMIASGGNDGVIHIWNPSASNLASSYQPVATINRGPSGVRALSWCPTKRGILAIGGGAADCSLSLVDCSAAVSGPDHASQSDHYHFYSKSKNSCFHQQQQQPQRGQSSSSSSSLASSLVSGGGGGGVGDASPSLRSQQELERISSGSHGIGSLQLVGSASSWLHANTTTKVSIQTGSQISQVLWSHDGSHLVTSHGFEYQNLPGTSSPHHGNTNRNNNNNNNNNSNNDSNINNPNRHQQHLVPAFNVAVWKVKDYGSSFSLLAHNVGADGSRGGGTIATAPHGHSFSSSRSSNNTNNLLSPGTRRFLSSFNDDTSNASPTIQRFLFHTSDVQQQKGSSRFGPSSSSSFSATAAAVVVEEDDDDDDDGRAKNSEDRRLRSRRFVPNSNSAFSRLVSSVVSSSLPPSVAVDNQQAGTASSAADVAVAGLVPPPHPVLRSQGAEKDETTRNANANSISANACHHFQHRHHLFSSSSSSSSAPDDVATPARRIVPLTHNVTGGASLPRQCPDGWFDVPYRDANNNNSSNNNHYNNNNEYLSRLDGSSSNENNTVGNFQNAAGSATTVTTRNALRSLNQNSTRPALRFSSLLSASATSHLVAVACASSSAADTINPSAASVAATASATARLDSVAKLIGHTSRPLFLVQRQSMRSLLVAHKTSRNICDAASSLMRQKTTSPPQSSSSSSGGDFISGAGGSDATVRLWDLFDDRTDNGCCGFSSSSSSTSPVDEAFYCHQQQPQASAATTRKLTLRKKVFAEEEVDFGTMLR